ncbi:MAG TPA: KUP/HAK/KT family potassium transporter [Polyangiaceae bacterium]|nr:KUP/HAK/KT family potassium transporter [Polyangiaceae bacterium]
MATRETLGSDDRCRDSPQPRSPWLLVLAALGVVYGDIGTSPLYAIRECFYGPHAIALTHGHVLGVLSVVFWALLHEQIVLFTVVADDRAHVDSQEQLEVTEIAPQLYRVVARCGYMQRPHVPQLLARCAEYGLAADPETTTYVLGHESVLAKGHGGMAR